MLCRASWRVQQGDNLGRYHPDVGDALTRNRLDERVWLEARMQDVRRAEVHGGQEREKRPVEDPRPSVQDDALWRDAKGPREERAIHAPNVVSVDNALRQAGGPAAVDDVVWIVIGQRDVWIVVAGGSRERVIVL